jgi:hypothetical protein
VYLFGRELLLLSFASLPSAALTHRVVRTFWYNIPKREKYTKMSPKYTNGHKIFQMAVKYVDQMAMNLPTSFFARNFEISQIGILGLNFIPSGNPAHPRPFISQLLR